MYNTTTKIPRSQKLSTRNKIRLYSIILVPIHCNWNVVFIQVFSFIRYNFQIEIHNKKAYHISAFEDWITESSIGCVMYHLLRIFPCYRFSEVKWKILSLKNFFSIFFKYIFLINNNIKYIARNFYIILAFNFKTLSMKQQAITIRDD